MPSGGCQDWNFLMIAACSLEMQCPLFCVDNHVMHRCWLVCHPQYFETIVLDLLHQMGYGTSRADLLRVGRSGDEGIDGVISLDRLGLERVYVQAKRWQSTVGRPEIQGFFGALAGQRANKGIFITTSSFTKQATEFAEGAFPISRSSV